MQTLRFTVEETRCLVLRDQQGTPFHAPAHPVSLQHHWYSMNSSHHSGVGSPRTTSRICSVAYSYDNPVIFLSKLDHWRVKGDIVISYAATTVGRLSQANGYMVALLMVGVMRWVGRSGAGHGTKVQTQRGLIHQVTEGSSQEWEFRCPCGNLGSGAESGPWHRAVPRRQGKGSGV